MMKKIKQIIIKWFFGDIFAEIKGNKEWKNISNYVNKDNILDLQMNASRKQISRYGKTMEELEKTVATLRRESHPPIFGEKDKEDILKRLIKIEKRR